MALFDTTAFRILEQGAAVMWQRNKVIQENISNQDTPDYNPVSAGCDHKPDERKLYAYQKRYSNQVM